MLSDDIAGYIDNYYSRTLGDAGTAYPPLKGKIETDVCVIGGGLAGINTAYSLVQRGKSVVLIEAKRLGWGASGRNGGFVAKGYAADDDDLVRRVGIDHARSLVELAKQARQIISRRINAHQIDCGPVTRGVMFASMKDNQQKIRDSVDRANESFGFGLEYWPTEKVRDHCRTEKYFQGYYSPDDFQFHPLRYLHGLARWLTEQGAGLYENSAALAIEKDGTGWRVTTAQGTVRAQHVVLCCAVYSHGLDKRLERATFPVKTYITVTKPLSDEVLRQSVNTPHPVYELRFASNYYRRLADNRILWGGRVGLWAEPHDIAKAQINDLLSIYPQLAGQVEADIAWSGLMAYAPHKMPQIGQMAPGYWYNTGFGGHGLVPTTVGGEVIAGAIATNDKAIDLFSPFGIGYAGGRHGRYVAQMVYWLWRARDYIAI